MLAKNKKEKEEKVPQKSKAELKSYVEGIPSDSDIGRSSSKAASKNKGSPGFPASHLQWRVPQQPQAL